MGRILVVDPSLLDRKRMRTMLEAAGHDVLEMSTPEQVMTEVLRLPPGGVKLVLTEVDFQGTPGIDLVRWLKAQESMKAVPVLVVTVPQRRETLIDLVTAGASTVIAKPFGGDLLLRRVTESLAEPVVLRQGEGEFVSWQLDDYLRRELKRAERAGTRFSVVVCTVLDPMDGMALPHFMGGLVHLMRGSDILARREADQIVILLPDTDWEGAAVVEGRIRSLGETLRQEEVGRMIVPLRIATGAATFPTDAGDEESLMRIAVARIG